MIEVPENWLTAKLADIAIIEMGQSPDSRSYNDRGEGLPFFQGKAEFGKFHPTVHKWCTEPTKTAEAGDILLSVRAPVGPTNLALERCCIGRGLAAIRAESPIDQKYLFHYFRNIEPWLSQQGTGTTFAAINREFVRNLDVLLAPLNEQKRIAESLHSLLERVDVCQTRLDRVRQILNRFRQSVLMAATSNRLTDEWRDEQAEISDWKSVTLREVAAEFSYGTSAKSQKSGKIPVLRMGNIQYGNLDWRDLVYTSDDDEIEKYNLLPGDVLFNRTNSPELVGKTAVYKGEMPAIYAGYLIRVRCGDDLLPDYLNYCLNSPAGRAWSWRVKSDGVSQSNINAQKLADFEIKLPPLAEQHEIVHRVEKLFAFSDKIEARRDTAQDHVMQLTPSLLAKAFRGELVEQDPNDEPASELLEHIKSARENAPKETRKLRRRSEMAIESAEKDNTRPGIVQTLKTSGKELSAQQLFQLAGYPLDAESEIVEEFFVEVREALENKLIEKERRNETDWFSLLKQ